MSESGRESAPSQTPPRALAVLDQWFGTLDENGSALPEKRERWFGKSASFDQLLRDSFGADVDAAIAGGLEEWDSTAYGMLALIVLLDQFARNIYRDTIEMYAGDERAKSLSAKLVTTGKHQELPHVYRVFSYMPLMHSETLADQDWCLELFQRLVADSPPALAEGFKNNLKYAHAHRDIIERFGRFPHRNAILRRSSSAEELEFLQRPGSSF